MPGASAGVASSHARERAQHVRPQGCRLSAVGFPPRPHDQIHRWEGGQRAAAGDLAQAAPHPVARYGSVLVPRHHHCEPRVRQGVGAPCHIDERGVQALPRRPRRVEVRPAREPQAPWEPLARLCAPVFRRQADGEALASLFAAPRQHRATPLVLHARAESVLVDAPPVARPIRRTTHCLPLVRGETYTARARRVKVDFPLGGPYLRAALAEPPAAVYHVSSDGAG